jgi:hypothetical protein
VFIAAFNNISVILVSFIGGGVQQFVHFAEINPNSFQSKSSKSKDDLISRTCSFGDFVLF